MMKKFISRVCVILLLVTSPLVLATDTVDLWFAPSWKTKAETAKAITTALSQASGVTVKPRIARGYPQILDEFKAGKPSLVYAGSFVSAIIRAGSLGEALVQGVTGKEMYSGVLIYKEGDNPQMILKQSPADIAFAVGASSGEASAKAATAGAASIKTKNHASTVGAIKAGKAKAGVVKNWWWEKNSHRYPGYAMFRIPGISQEQNPDNVLTASNAISPVLKAKIVRAAKSHKEVFKANDMRDFDASALDFTISLMVKGKIDPNNYRW